MKRIRISALLLAAALVAAAFAGCGGSNTKSVDTSQPPGPGPDQPQSQRERGTMAKVVSLDGDQLTVILADMPQGGGDRTPPEGVSGGALQPSGEEPGQPTADGKGQPPANGNSPGGEAVQPPADGNDQRQGDGSALPGQGGREISFTGEEATYTLSGDVVVMKGTGDGASKIDLSQLRPDDVIRFTTTTDGDGNETIDGINVLD